MNYQKVKLFLFLFFIYINLYLYKQIGLKEEKNKKFVGEVKLNKNIINLAFNIDNKYIYQSLVLMTSLLDNIGPNTKYQIHILHSKSFEQRYIDKLNKFVENCPNNTFNLFFYNMQNNFTLSTRGLYISIAAYYRIALPSILPNESRIIYIDTDVINFEDLTEMYNLELKDNIYFRGTLDNPALSNEIKKLGIYIDKYMNDGIMLINLEAMRKDNVEKKIRDFVITHFLDHHDQTAINAICYDHWEILPYKYAMFRYNKFKFFREINEGQNIEYRISENELRKAYNKPTFVHYVGYTKPWNKNNKDAFNEYWWYYAKKSMFYEEILSIYNFNQSDVDKLIEKIPSDGGLLRNYKK